MNLSLFCKQASLPSFWLEHKIIQFSSASYPHLFFDLLFEMAQKKKLFSIEFKKISLGSLSFQELASLLSQSFLGMYKFYWLGDIGNLSTKDKNAFVNFIKTYQGDNFIGFFSTEAISLTKAQQIHLPYLVEEAIMDDLIELLDQTINASKHTIIKKYLAHIEALPLDIFCAFIQQASLTHARDLQQIIKNLALPEQPQAQLTKLTEYFFSYEEKLFYNQWSLLHKEYPDIFWVSFWAETLWKAYFAVQFLEQKKFAEAKKISYRLPHSFLQNGYKKIDLEKIIELYNFLYSIDFGLKQGSLFCSLDLFYVRHFEKHHPTSTRKF